MTNHDKITLGTKSALSTESYTQYNVPHLYTFEIKIKYFIARAPPQNIISSTFLKQCMGTFNGNIAPTHQLRAVRVSAQIGYQDDVRMFLQQYGIFTLPPKYILIYVHQHIHQYEIVRRCHQYETRNSNDRIVFETLDPMERSTPLLTHGF